MRDISTILRMTPWQLGCSQAAYPAGGYGSGLIDAAGRCRGLPSPSGVAGPVQSTVKPWLQGAVRPWLQGGGAGWLVIGVLVLAWDMAAPETLSAAFHRAKSGPVGGTAVAVAWALLTGHLFEVLPKRADPFRLSIDTVRKALQRGDKRMVPG